MIVSDRHLARPPGERRTPPRAEPQSGGWPTSLDLVKKLYAQGPHAALYTPFCKVKHVLAGCQYLVSTDGQHLSAVVAHSREAIEFTWSLTGRAETLRNLIAQVQHRLGDLTFVPVLETGRRSWSQMLGLPVCGRYFRVTLRNPKPQPVNIPLGLEIVPFHPERDTQAAAKLMNEAYPSLPQLMCPEKLQEMTRTDYFFSDGWFFLRDRREAKRVGLAICGYCEELEEGFIDWLEVLPRYRHRGLGASLVREAIRRLCDRARFVTASGSLEAPFVVGDLYTECGFQQARQWTILGHRSGRTSATAGGADYTPIGGPQR